MKNKIGKDKKKDKMLLSYNYYSLFGHPSIIDMVELTLGLIDTVYNSHG